MDRNLQPYAGTPSSTLARPVAPANPMLTVHPPKSAADFVRAIRRRFALIVVVMTIVGTAGAVYVVRLPAIYKAVGQIQIEPPRSDPAAATIIGNGASYNDREANEKYVPNRLAWLVGRRLAEEVVNQPDIGAGRGFEGDPAGEIVGMISTRKAMPLTNIYEVSLEGADPERVKTLLEHLLRSFQDRMLDESTKQLESASGYVLRSIGDLDKEITSLDREIREKVKQSPIFAPGGKNLLQEDYTALSSMLMTKRARFEDMKYEGQIAAMYPALKGMAPPSRYAPILDKLAEKKIYLENQLENVQRLAKKFDGDAAARNWARQLNKVLDDIDRYTALDAKRTSLPNLPELQLQHSSEEIRKLERDLKDKLNEVQESLPEYQKYLTLMREREQKEANKAAMETRLVQFQLISKTTKNPVEILLHPAEPGSPVRPNRPMMIAGISLLGCFLGIGLVCVREFLDHSVKVPEHLTGGLGLPLFGVIPRIRRLAQTHRGGHLWTHAAPNSLEADAYRNLRASLLGLNGPKGPMITLLVTSAKAGEGKSTTALNLAATCARAGERTLLMDVDLRRPSLGDVFEGNEPGVGLVDVLRGEMPWQQAVVRTDLPNLHFLPTGDPTGVPIEILGTLELRQLIAAVSQQYHRVILDGPAVLGLADCRMLGRAADAALLVVRSGAHDLRPLRRAKDMLEQSRVSIAGVVFNGLSEDLENWSSYGMGSFPIRDSGRTSPVDRGLDAPTEGPVAAHSNA